MVLRILWNIGAGFLDRALSGAARKPGFGLAYPAVWRSRAMPWDLDVNLHMNNAAFLKVVDLARWYVST